MPTKGVFDLGRGCTDTDSGRNAARMYTEVLCCTLLLYNVLHNSVLNCTVPLSFCSATPALEQYSYVLRLWCSVFSALLLYSVASLLCRVRGAGKLRASSASSTAWTWMCP